MKLYTYSIAPNPQRIELAIAEKQIEIARVQVDLKKGEQLSAAYKQKNPHCDVPMLELPDGTCISQVPAIASYLEETFPARPLFGSTAKQKAQVIMWEHLCAIDGLQAVGEVLRNTAKAMENRAMVGPHNYAQVPALAERGRARARNFFADLDKRLQGSEYVAGDFFSMADITAWVTCNFAGWIKEFMPAECSALQAWHQRLALRPAFNSEQG
ncbi:MAG: glutathione S-transferase [Gammaproteobacteria bacterium]|nr:glutathione S-transferase [Gammaproteobacteria bacterium]